MRRLSILSQSPKGAGDRQLSLRLRSVARYRRHQLIKGYSLRSEQLLRHLHLLLTDLDSVALRKRSTQRASVFRVT